MPLTVFPPSQGPTGQTQAMTRAQTSIGSPNDLTTPDPLGVNAASFITTNILFANAAHTGAIFSATLTGTTGDRFRFQVKPLGAGGSAWKETAAMEMGSGYWDYVHRAYDGGVVFAWLVPCPGAQDVRMVRETGTPGAGTCIAFAVSSHNAFPSPPKFVGKRDMAMMVRTQVIASDSAYHLLLFDWSQSNDDRTRTLTSGITTHPINGGKRLWIQGYDLAYKPSATAGDYVVANVVARANGAVSTSEANSPPIFELDLFSAPGRAVTLPEPIELQNALGSNQGSIGIKAKGQPGGGILGGSVYCFETL